MGIALQRHPTAARELKIPCDETSTKLDNSWFAGCRFPTVKSSRASRPCMLRPKDLWFVSTVMLVVVLKSEVDERVCVFKCGWDNKLSICSFNKRAPYLQQRRGKPSNVMRALEV